MEGLTRINAMSPVSGTLSPHFEAEFVDPPAAVIDALEYAMLNGLPIPIPNIGPVIVLKMDVRTEHASTYLDAITYGSINSTYLVQKNTIRRVVVYARGT